MWVFAGEPGYEHIETIKGISNAAKSSGITSIACRPDTNPIIVEAELVQYIIRKSENQSEIKILPIAALTKKHEGGNMTEIGLLADAGAVGFSDAYHQIDNTNLLKNVFTYASNFDAQILNLCVDKDSRGLGFGEKIMDLLIEEIKSRGLNEIYLEVRSSNIQAISLYKKKGFELIGVRQNYYMDHNGREDAKVFFLNTKKIGYKQ